MLDSPPADLCWSAAEVLTLLTHLLLPLAHQLTPELTLLLAPSVPPESAILAEHVTHQLSALAGGRLVVIGGECCLPPLLGRPPRHLPPLGPPSVGAVWNLRRVIDHQRQHWPGLPAVMKKVPESAVEGRKSSTIEPFH